MQLYLKKYGESGKAIIIIHGLFGMLDNWHSIAKDLSITNRVYTVDARNHGQSPHSPVMNYRVMADDIWELMQSESLSEVILMGHSMGGKVALMFANKFPEKLDKLVVVDIAPKKYEPNHTLYFEALKAINLKASGRKEIEEQLALRITNNGELLFLLKNLYRKDNGEFGLKIHLEAIENNYSEIMDAITFTKPITIPTLFIKGEHSRYISEDDIVDIKSVFTQVSFSTIPGAGHWVHADNAKGFLVELKQFIHNT